METRPSRVYFSPLSGTCPHCAQPVTVLYLDAHGRGRCWRCRGGFAVEDVSPRAVCTSSGLVVIDGSLLVARRGDASSLVLPESITRVADSCFRGDRTLWRISLPGVVEVGSRAFRRCTLLAHVDLGHHAVSVGERAFDGCTNLRDVQVPGTLRLVGRRAFRDCPSLERPDLPAGCLVAPDAFEVRHRHWDGP